MHDSPARVACLRCCSLFIGALALLSSCTVPLRSSSQQSQETGPLGAVTTSARVGPGRMNLAQVQAEVEAFSDRYVAQVSQATNRAARANPEARERLHAVKLAVGRGTYTIAAGPNPVVSLLDLIVQATLVRHSVEANLAKSLPEESGPEILSVFTSLEAEAWALGERVLPAQDLADLRVLIDTWLQENPNVVYVANIRFSDFARLSPRPGSSLPSTIFGLLRLDPFASIDPAAREMQEARLLTERVFYYLQRMPQLLAWQTEGLYFELVGAPETQQLLTNIDEFAETSKQVSDTFTQLPAQIQDRLAESEQTVGAVLEQMNDSMAQANETLVQVDQTAANLRQMTEAVADAGRAWTETANAVNAVAATMNSPDDPDKPPSEPMTVHDVTTALEEAQATAVELRLLLSEFSTMTSAGTIEGSVSTSVARARQGAQSIIITITVCTVIVIVAIVAGAIIYRAVTSRWSAPRRDALES